MNIKNKKLKTIFEFALIILGTAIMGLSFNIFFIPNEISPSGFSGLSNIIHTLILRELDINIPTSILFLLINLILFIFAYKVMGKKFAISSMIGIISYSIFIEFLDFTIFKSSDMLLIAIYGGVLMGFGLSLVFKGKGSTGGSDLLANMINKKRPEISLGTVVIIVDTIVVILSIFAFGIAKSLYSLIAIVIMGKISDLMMTGVHGVRAYFIISSQNEKIAQRVLNELSRGVTGMTVSGMHSHMSRSMIMVLVNKGQSTILKDIVAECDKNAFMFSTTVSEAIGNGFMPLRKRRSIVYMNKKRLKLFNANKCTKFKYKCIVKKSLNLKRKPYKKLVNKAFKK